MPDIVDADVDENDCPLLKKCQTIDVKETLNITLLVYNDSGVSEHCEQLEDTTPHRSAFDVLRHIRIVTFSDHPRPENMEFQGRSTWPIDTVHEEQAGNICGSHAEMDIVVDVCQKHSITIDAKIFDTCEVYNCEGQQMCKEQPPNCEE